MKVRVCNRCETPVKRTETPGYAYYCPWHDEDLYEFETVVIEDFRELGSRDGIINEILNG